MNLPAESESGPDFQVSLSGTFQSPPRGRGLYGGQTVSLSRICPDSRLVDSHDPTFGNLKFAAAVAGLPMPPSGLDTVMSLWKPLIYSVLAART
eukprot:767805-Hanusia_phi.AAC.4